MTDPNAPAPADDPGDPGIPSELLERLENVCPMKRDSGLLILGLGEPPVFRNQVRGALRRRFGLTSESALDQAERIIDKITRDTYRAMELERRESARSSWVFGWEPPSNGPFQV